MLVRLSQKQRDRIVFRAGRAYAAAGLAHKDLGEISRWHRVRDRELRSYVDAEAYEVLGDDKWAWFGDWATARLCKEALFAARSALESAWRRQGRALEGYREHGAYVAASDLIQWDRQERQAAAEQGG